MVQLSLAYTVALFIWGTFFSVVTGIGIFHSEWGPPLPRFATRTMKIWAFLEKLYRIFQMLVLPVSSAADWWSDVLLLIQMTEYDMNLVYISIATLVGHSLLSSFIIFFDSPVNSRCFRFSLHLFQALVIYEVYQAMKVGRVSYEVHQIRVLEGCFESGPQALLQLYFLSKYTNDYSIALISLSFSLLCLANVSNYSDSFGLKGSTSINYWNTILISLRTFELALRFSLLVYQNTFHE